MGKKSLSVDLNLDDENEVEIFIAQHGKTNGRRLANRLGLRGKNSMEVANALSNYAFNKATAIKLRKKGEVNTAQKYEVICDRIYKEDIQPFCECW